MMMITRGEKKGIYEVKMIMKLKWCVKNTYLLIDKRKLHRI